MGSIRSKTVFFVIAACASVALFLLAGFFYWYRRTTAEHFRQLINTRLSDTDVVFNNYLDSTAAIVNSFFNSTSGRLTRVSDDFDVAGEIKFIYQLQDMLIFNTHIQSVYFFNNRGEVPLWVKGEGQFTEDLDEILLDKLYMRPASQSPFLWSVGHRHQKEKAVNLLSFYMSEVPYGSDSYTGTVTVNVDLNVLCKRILSESGGETDSIIVLDKNGVVVLHSDSSRIGENWSGKEYINAIITESETSFRENVDGTVYEFTALKSRRPSFFIISQSEYAGGMLNDSGILSILLAVTLAGSVFMTAVILLVGTRIFKPLTNIIGELKQSELAPDHESGGDEVKFLRSYFSRINEHLAGLHEKAGHDLIVRSLMLEEESVNVQPLLLESGILTEGRGYYVLGVFFSDSGNVKMQSVDKKRDEIKDLFIRALSPKWKCTGFEWGLRYLFFFISEKPDSAPGGEDPRARAVRAMADAGKLDATRVYAVISGRLPDGATACKSAFKSIDDKLRLLRIYEPDGNVAFEDSQVPFKFNNDTVNLIVSSLKQNNRSSYRQAVEQIFGDLRAAGYQEFVSAVTDITERILQVKKAMRQDGGESATGGIHMRIRAIDSQEAFFDFFESNFSDVSEKIEKLASVTSADLLEDAVTFIRAHYDDALLGVAMLAGRMHISAHYFGQLFREYTGSSVTDYIIQIRMENARNFLLTNPDKDIAEIAEKVGYSSNSYFATAFKKYYGVAPSKLRNTLRID